MRRIERTAQFKRDYKRKAKGPHQGALANAFVAIVKRLANDQPLAGRWKDHRNCHVKPDLVLIYRKPDDTVLQLVRLGSHSELGL